MAFSPDGRRIVSGSSDNTVRLWNTDTGQQIGQPLTGHTEWVNSVAVQDFGHREQGLTAAGVLGDLVEDRVDTGETERVRTTPRHKLRQ